LFHAIPTKHRVRIWRARESALYQKRIDGRKTWSKSFICVCARRQPLPRNKFSVRNVICTRSGKLRTLQRKLSRATSRVVKSSGVACPSLAVLRRYQRLYLPTSSEKTCCETHPEWVNLIESTKSVVSWPHCYLPVIPMEYNELLTWFYFSTDIITSTIVITDAVVYISRKIPRNSTFYFKITNYISFYLLFSFLCSSLFSFCHD